MVEDLKESLSQEPTESLKQQLVETVKEYKESYQKLKDFKMEIEHLQHLLEQARLRLTRDFEHWYVNVYESTEISDPKSMDMADLKTSDMTVPEMAHHTVKTIDTLKSRSRPSSRLGPRSTDDDIEAFYKARDEILKLKSRRNGQDTKSVIE
ncbi:hypothetical protein EDD86DRAFT_146380 [Gorgonomyces haynaldii]|nr:hypothetical protein EDD86DRAFT_146380 [Gorgonomyces haynaldii]